ncbi:strawberry notch-like protein, partial [Trifolium medium]|nr:strawberry notch-like protein [Trifolium medium]
MLTQLPPPPPSVLRARAAVWRLKQRLFPQQRHRKGAMNLPRHPNHQMPDVFSTYPYNDRPRCPACMALVNIPNNLSNCCPNCFVQLDVNDHGEEEVNE